jgi:hypothetical protein
VAGGDFLGQKFTELAQLDQNRGRIVKKEAFRQRP